MLALLLQPLRTRTVCASAIARETRLQDTTTDSQLSHTRVRPSAHARTHTRTHRPAKWRRYDVVPLPREVAAAVHRLGSIGCPPPSPLPLVSMRKGRSKRNSLPRPSKTSQRTQALRAISQALRAAPPDPLFTPVCYLPLCYLGSSHPWYHQSCSSFPRPPRPYRGTAAPDLLPRPHDAVCISARPCCASEHVACRVSSLPCQRNLFASFPQRLSSLRRRHHPTSSAPREEFAPRSGEA